MLCRHGPRVSEDIMPRRDQVKLAHARLWVERLKNSLSVEHPIAAPAADVQIEGWKPDPSVWILCINGHEFAPVERSEDVAGAPGIERPRPRGLMSRGRALLGSHR
jgi:hypothetical protein